jgi:uncharacterized protein YjiS (DUF1127 family)
MSQTVSSGFRPNRADGAYRLAVTGAAGWIRGVLKAGVELWIARRDERILMQAPAHQLRDLGIERRDIRSAVRTGRVGGR